MAEGMLQGKVALITGSGRGIGRSMAILMASRGASVVVNDVGAGLHGETTGETPAQEVVDTIKKAGGNAVANYDSVSDWDGAHRMVKQAVDAFGKIDIVVNNAGILRDVMFHKMTPEEFDAVTKVHLFGSIYVSRAAAPEFRKQESGCYIHMTSVSGLFGNIGQVNYGAAKTGIVGLSNTLAQELAKYNVRSNCISPSGNTRMTQSVPVRGTEEEKKAREKKMAATPPESPGILATFLASDLAKDINGQVIGARGSEIQLYSHSRPVRFLNHKGGWTPELLAESLPKLAPLFSPVVPAKAWASWAPD
jgi:NAD(P)-dependent dehydrogenase (short-subunit alcohol dehydrogenase family)